MSVTATVVSPSEEPRMVLKISTTPCRDKRCPLGAYPAIVALQPEVEWQTDGSCMVGSCTAPSFFRIMDNQLAATARLEQRLSEVESEFSDLRSECGNLRSECGNLRSECGNLRSECGNLRSIVRFTAAGTTPDLIVAEAWKDLSRSTLKPQLLLELQRRSKQQQAKEAAPLAWDPTAFSFPSSDPAMQAQAAPSSPSPSSTSSDLPMVGDFVELGGASSPSPSSPSRVCPVGPQQRPQQRPTGVPMSGRHSWLANDAVSDSTSASTHADDAPRCGAAAASAVGVRGSSARMGDALCGDGGSAEGARPRPRGSRAEDAGPAGSGPPASSSSCGSGSADGARPRPRGSRAEEAGWGLPASSSSSEPPTVGDFVEQLVAACAPEIEDEEKGNPSSSHSGNRWPILRLVTFEQTVAAMAEFLNDPTDFIGGEDWPHAELMASMLTEVLRSVFESVIPGPWSDGGGAGQLDKQPSASSSGSPSSSSISASVSASVSGMSDEVLSKLVEQCAKASALRQHRNSCAAHPFSSKGAVLSKMLMLLGEAVKMQEVVAGMEDLAQVAASHMADKKAKEAMQPPVSMASGRRRKLPCVK